MVNSSFLAPVSIINRERHVGVNSVENMGYREGLAVDELKPHNVFGTKNPCKIKRGVIIATQNRGRSATIKCECGSKVQEAI